MPALAESKSRPPRLPWAVYGAGFVLCLVPVFWVGGVGNGFAYWNAFPIVIAFIVLAIFGLSRAAQSFAIFAIGFTELAHVVWMGDWGRTATGSSTSGLIFIFLPFWSLLFGLLAAGVVRVLARSASRVDSRSARHHRPHLE